LRIDTRIKELKKQLASNRRANKAYEESPNFNLPIWRRQNQYEAVLELMIANCEKIQARKAVKHGLA